MEHPISSGAAAALLGVTEPRLNDLIRRGKFPPPPVQAGRRLWQRDHIVQAAEALGLSLDDIAALAANDGGY